ncbi:hypothetical protein [Jidongwangia harbinensis]|uniref:hypothetical protein n=1 Tax=Jidongwangia harbinensis TaxID=2878561 RepID=UPI001CD9DA87|nr:hypothetical protein [Jidongwangia harbinensis]MCA2212805.1 hypothetical protein [Jidongwangia harbinensis]
MTLRGLGRRVTAGFTVVAAVTGTVALAARAAAAAEPHHTVTEAFLAYTDAATPTETTYWPDRDDLPVGAARDEGGTAHTHRVYVAFEIGGLNAARLSGAQLRASEYAVADCSVERSLSARPVVPFDGHTWANPPAAAGAAVRLNATGPGCESGLTAELTTALDRALARGQDRLWVELRVPQRHETDPRYGRRLYDEVRLEVTLTNRPPDQPTGLAVGNPDIRCSDDFAVNADFSVFATMTDPDRDPDDLLTPEFEFWNTATPGTRIAMNTGVSSGSDLRGVGDVPTQTLPDGRYAWHARVFDTRAHSPWSDPCHFTVDRTAPGSAPTVSSPEYPEDSPVPTGQVDQRGTFLFTANGVPDVAAFEYGPDRWSLRRVAADQPGGAATVRWAPGRTGVQSLIVRSIDRAGNRSPERTYRINVRGRSVDR